MPLPEGRFADIARATRLEKGLTQVVVAGKIGCAQNAVSAWEKGVSHPVGRNLVVLCDVLGLDLGEVAALIQREKASDAEAAVA